MSGPQTQNISPSPFFFLSVPPNPPPSPRERVSSSPERSAHSLICLLLEDGMLYVRVCVRACVRGEAGEDGEVSIAHLNLT